jgi:dolichol-phosphate mannosyltransferase
MGSERHGVAAQPSARGGDARRDLLSIVIPCFDEAGCLEALHDGLEKACAALDVEREYVFVDDGSRDDTRATLRRMSAADERVRWVGFARNFGHQAALTAGLEAARGRWVVSMDGDLQHPPETIPALYARAREGFDLVLTKRIDSDDSSFAKRLTSRCFYRVLSRLSGVEIPPGSSDFRLMSRKALDALLAMPERHRFLRAMVLWTGFRPAYVEYRAAARHAGTSAYGFRKMLRLAADGMFSFSTIPLRIALVLGLVITTVAAGYGVYAIYARLVLGTVVAGWTSMLVVVLFLGGVQILSLGLIGEYLGRAYDELKARPQYVVEETGGFAEHD